jgi:hypothetical protein
VHLPPRHRLLHSRHTAMTYKLFVRFTTGNESGGDAMTVTRPL